MSDNFEDVDAAVRLMLIQNFDEARPSFLAALDQAVAEVKPMMADMSGFRQESIVQGALAFSDMNLVRGQIAELQPDLFAYLDDEELSWMHIVILSYLLSLLINENARNRHRQEMPPL